MAHVRQQIRAQVVTDLIAAATSAASRVYPSREYPLDDTLLPAIRVYTTDEVSEIADGRTMGAAPTLLRKTLLTVECVLKATGSIDDAMDAIAVQVEAALAENHLGGIIKDIVIAGTETDISVEGEKPVGLVRMNYELLYITSTADPETAL